MLLWLDGGSPVLDFFNLGGAPTGGHVGAGIMAAGSFSKKDSPKGVSISGSTNPNYKQIPHTEGLYKPAGNTRNNTNNVLPTNTRGGYRGR